MTARGVLLLVACAVITGCTASNSVVCGTLTCSQGAVCTPSGDACVSPAQLESCKGKADDDGCSYPGASTAVCVSSVCTEIGCGNHHVDMQLGEVCDDGNRISGDGCSADCASTEQCGDGIVDLAQGEECDAGTNNSDAFGTVCHTSCIRPRCGDTLPDPGEACDDGNNLPGDGCRADCLGRWEPMTIGSFADIKAIYGLSNDDVFAVGADKLFHWNGSAWSKVHTPSSAVEYTRVFAASSTDVWLVTSNTLWHGQINGSTTTWADKTPPTMLGVDGVHGRGLNDVWAIGGNSSAKGVVAQWNGSTWTEHNDATMSANPTAIWVSPTDEIFVTDSNGVHMRKGTTWTTDNTFTMNKLYGVSDTDVYACGATVYHFDGDNWNPLVGGEESGGCFGISATSGEALVVSGQGRIVSCNDSKCVVSPSGVSNDLTCAWGSAANHAFVGGYNGTMLR